MSKIIIKNLNHTYKDKVILKDMNLSFPNHGFIGLVGYSGSGKTTLINIIAGLLKPLRGIVEVDGIDITTLGKESLRKYRLDKLSYVHQGNSLIGQLTGIENIELAINIKNMHLDQEKLYEYACKLKIDDLLNKKTVELSGGERKRVEILREIMRDADVFILDEPTSALDEESSDIIFEVLKEISKKKLIITSTHQIDITENYLDILIDISEEKYQLVNLHHIEDKVDVKEEKKINDKVGFKLNYQPNILKMIVMTLLLVVSTIFVAYRYQNREEVISRIIYENDQNKMVEVIAVDLTNVYEEIEYIQNNLPSVKIRYYYDSPISLGKDHFVDKSFEMNNFALIYDRKFEIQYGRAPEAEDEILITKLHFDLFKLYGYKDSNQLVKTINDYSDIVNEVFTKNGKTYKIVGIVDTNYDEKINIEENTETNDLLRQLILSYHASVYIYDEEISNRIDSRPLIDLSELSLREMTLFIKRQETNHNIIYNHYSNTWMDRINSDLDYQEKTIPHLSLYIVFSLIFIMVIINTYLTSMELNKTIRVDSIKLLLGIKDEALIKEKIINHSIDYGIVIGFTYLLNGIIILIINMILNQKYKLIFNMLKGNLYIYLMPINLGLVLIGLCSIQTIIKVKTTSILKNIN